MRLLGTLAFLFVATFASAAEVAPAISLVNAVDGELVTVKPNDGKLKVIVFTSTRCEEAKPFEPRLMYLANRFGYRGVDVYLVSATDDPASMKARADGEGYPFPYLVDKRGELARAFGARVTPEAFVVDGEGVVRYRGMIEDSAHAAQRKEEPLASALTALLNGRDVARAQTTAFGCEID
jgi:peroxiredoxin